MITHYTVRFGAAVSQKELEKALNESGETPTHVPNIRKSKARIEFIGDFARIPGTAPAKMNSLALHLETSNESQR
jgi:hypothetical protein